MHGYSTGHKTISSPVKIFLLLMVALSLLVSPAAAQTPPTTPGVPSSGNVPSWANGIGQKGLVAVSQPNAARAGAEMLAKGGNAIDAAAAIQFTLNVEEPMMTGIGGGAFIMIYLANSKQVVVIDAREREPLKGRPDQFLGPDGKPLSFEDAQSHGNAVGVPGTLAGTAMALERYGTMKLSDVMQPAIRLADGGFVVSDWFASMMPDYVWKLSKGPGSAYTMLHADGTPVRAGEMLVQKDLANTLRMISDQGIKAFYGGPLGDAVADIVKKRGGPMEPSDIATYSPLMREPTRGSYRGYEIVSMPPPSSGGLTLIQMLNMLERFNIKSMGQNTPDTLQAMIEAMHLAYADRGKFMGDADFIDIPAAGLLNPQYVASRSAMIDPSKTNPNVSAGDPGAFQGSTRPLDVEVVPLPESNYTTHFVTADKAGNVVAWTTTIEDAWGSGIMVPGFGFMLNNEMTDFSFTPGVANEVQPMKRPRSSMNPTLVLKDGKPWMATGSPGGSTIITTTLQVIMNLIDHGMSVQDAVNAPRIFSSSYPNVQWENGIPQSVLDELTRRGDKFGPKPDVIGSAQSLVIDMQSGRMYGAGDPRRLGTVISVAEAADGKSLWSESPAQRASFEAVWGAMAAERWAYEHNQSIGR